MKAQQTITRPNGAEVKIVAEECFGAGLHRSVSVFVLYRGSNAEEWSLASDRPHPDWRSMSVEEYKRHGRSKMLQVATPAEILKTINQLE